MHQGIHCHERALYFKSKKKNFFLIKQKSKGFRSGHTNTIILVKEGEEEKKTCIAHSRGVHIVKVFQKKKEETKQSWLRSKVF